MGKLVGMGPMSKYVTDEEIEAMDKGYLYPERVRYRVNGSKIFEISTDNKKAGDRLDGCMCLEQIYGESLTFSELKDIVYEFIINNKYNNKLYDIENFNAFSMKDNSYCNNIVVEVGGKELIFQNGKFTWSRLFIEPRYLIEGLRYIVSIYKPETTNNKIERLELLTVDSENRIKSNDDLMKALYQL